MAKPNQPLFAGQASRINQLPKPTLSPWRVLVVDDEPAIHSVTRLVLNDFEWEGRGLQFYNALSAADARKLMETERDFAVCLIDVVMETNDAGLELVRFIRNEIGDSRVRLVLRTGQPGYAPEKAVIREYDINDYKDKTELTDTKLDTLMCSALRNYRDIMRLERSREGLERVIRASSKIFRTTSLREFTSAVLMQLVSLIDFKNDALFVRVVSGFTATTNEDEFQILAGVGNYQDLVDCQDWSHLGPRVRELVSRASHERTNIYGDGELVLFSESRLGSQHLLYLQHEGEIPDLDRRLIDLFCANVCVAYENHTLHNEVEDAQEEMIYCLSDAVENRSLQGCNYNRRVAEISYLLSLELGMGEEEALKVRVAAPLHDIGKIAIPEHILNKPARLNDEEMAIMRQHVEQGRQMLAGSNRPIIQLAAIIVQEHHEHWDGKGYPRGLKGEAISLPGRIVAVADVFDALVNWRCYENTWSMEDATRYMQEQSGKQFDPTVVAAFNRTLPEIIAIQRRYRDPLQAQQ